MGNASLVYVGDVQHSHYNSYSSSTSKALMTQVSKCVLVVTCATVILIFGLMVLPPSYRVDRKPAPAMLKKNCCEIAVKAAIEDLCHQDGPKILKECSCKDYMLCKLIVVTALSSNHYRESKDFFRSVLSEFPDLKIIVYDLGLAGNEANAIHSYCNVREVRKFNFALYPPHTKNLQTYAWKPFIVEQVSEEYELIFYCDASCRMQANFTESLPRLIQFPIMPARRLGHSVVRTTHDGMLEYLTPHLKRPWMVNVFPIGVEATGLLFLVTNMLKDKILTPWVDCAKHVKCIAPQGAKLWPCYFNSLPNTSYVDCHRFDQSAINVILIREFGSDLSRILGLKKEKFVKVVRKATADYDTSYSRACGIR